MHKNKITQNKVGLEKYFYSLKGKNKGSPLYIHTYTVFLVFKSCPLKVDKLVNVTRMNTKPGKLTAADKMEKRIVLASLTVHFLKQMPCFSSLFSGVPVIQAFAK